MHNQEARRDLSPIIYHFKDHTIPTYVTRKNLNAFSQKYQNADISNFDDVPKLRKNQTSPLSYSCTDFTQKELNSNIVEENPKDGSPNCGYSISENQKKSIGSVNQRLVMMEKKLQKIEKRLKGTEKFMFATIEFEKKKNQLQTLQLVNDSSILYEKIQEIVQAQLKKHGLQRKNDLQKCQQTIEELKDLLNEDIKIECDNLQNTSVESIRQLKDYCEELVLDSEQKIKKLLKINLQVLKKDFAISMHKIYQQIQKANKHRNINQYFGSILGRKENQQSSIKYFIDSCGQIMDSDGFYLVNSRGQSFQLGKEHLDKLKQLNIYMQKSEKQ